MKTNKLSPNQEKLKKVLKPIVEGLLKETAPIPSEFKKPLSKEIFKILKEKADNEIGELAVITFDIFSAIELYLQNNNLQIIKK